MRLKHVQQRFFVMLIHNLRRFLAEMTREWMALLARLMARIP